MIQPALIIWFQTSFSKIQIGGLLSKLFFKNKRASCNINISLQTKSTFLSKNKGLRPQIRTNTVHFNFVIEINSYNLMDNFHRDLFPLLLIKLFKAKKLKKNLKIRSESWISDGPSKTIDKTLFLFIKLSYRFFPLVEMIIRKINPPKYLKKNLFKIHLI